MGALTSCSWMWGCRHQSRHGHQYLFQSALWQLLAQLLVCAKPHYQDSMQVVPQDIWAEMKPSASFDPTLTLLITAPHANTNYQTQNSGPSKAAELHAYKGAHFKCCFLKEVSSNASVFSSISNTLTDQNEVIKKPSPMQEAVFCERGGIFPPFRKDYKNSYYTICTVSYKIYKQLFQLFFPEDEQA